tara:strand:- start:101 stop:460 length:360 start_codon:yes stop_codon:yes gene_type:complete
MMSNVITNLIPFLGIAKRTGDTGSINNDKETVMSRSKLSKTAKIRNLFAKGSEVSWKQLRNTYDLKSPAAMVGKLRNEGMMIYENRSSKGVSYRVGTPSKAIIAAGINKVFGKQVAYSA